MRRLALVGSGAASWAALGPNRSLRRDSSTMVRQAGVALGAGIASALLFVVSAKGTTAAALIAYFTALPIMIAGLGFGHMFGLTGAVLATGGVSLVLGPVLGAFYALCFALPGWWLSYLALLAQPTAAQGAALTWYPVGRLVTWAAALAIAAVLALGAIVLVRYGGFEAATHILARRIDAAVSQTPSAPDTAMFFVRILPLAMAASLFLMLSVNLWLAGRVARVSERLRRPWPEVPEGLRLPVAAAGFFLVALLPAAFGGPIGTAAGVVAAALGLAFALQGLGAAHVLTRGFRGRGSILALIYIVTLAIPVAVVALCLIGLVDCLFSLRNRRPPPKTPMPT